MTYYNKISDIRNKKYKQRFTNELKCLVTDDVFQIQQNTNDDTDNAILDRTNQLKTIIKALDDKQKNTQKNMFDEMEKYIYKKLWIRLNKINKIKKLKEFIETYDELGEQKEEILLELIEMVKSKKINTKKAVDYDYEDEKILSIHILKYNKKLKKYVI